MPELTLVFCSFWIIITIKKEWHYHLLIREDQTNQNLCFAFWLFPILKLISIYGRGHQSDNCLFDLISLFLIFYYGNTGEGAFQIVLGSLWGKFVFQIEELDLLEHKGCQIYKDPVVTGPLNIILIHKILLIICHKQAHHWCSQWPQQAWLLSSFTQPTPSFLVFWANLHKLLQVWWESWGDHKMWSQSVMETYNWRNYCGLGGRYLTRLECRSSL